MQNQSVSKKIIAIVGPTASGKTQLSIDIAKHLQTEIISADSRQFYKELLIGTAAPTEDEMGGVKHHFVRFLSVEQTYNVIAYEHDALKCSRELFKTYDVLVLAGGSGLYIDAFCKGLDDLPDSDPDVRKNLEETLKTEGIESLRAMLKQLDPAYYKVVDLANPARLLRALEVCITTGKPFSSFRSGKLQKRDFDLLTIGLNPHKDELHKRIHSRVDKMMEQGLLEEAQQLLKYRTLPALKTVGYKELFEYFDNKISLNEAIEQIKKNTRRYAKRQMTWFRRNHEIKWFHPEQKNNIFATIENFINTQ